MNKKTLYIHIGCEKTGTTSIQNVLADNRSELLKQGTFYPELGKLKFAQIVLPAALQPLDTPDRPRADYYPGNENIDTDTIWNGFIKLAQENADKNIILSAEHFSSRTHEQGLQYLSKKMQQLLPLFNIKVVVYLRRQDKFMESTYSTIIKAGGRLSFDAFYNAHLPLRDRYDFSILLSRWRKFFDKDQLVVKDYETEVKSKGLLTSFFEIVGINGQALSMKSQNENTSWPANVIELARLCNSPRIIEILGNDRFGFLNEIAKSLSKEERNHVYKFSSEQRQEILRHYADTNIQVETEYFQHQPIFSELTVAESKAPSINSEVSLNKMDIVELISRFYMANKKAPY